MSDRFFIGRERELQRFEQFLLRDTASIHNPRIAHVWGPSGIGKTAFFEAFSKQLAQEDGGVMWFAFKNEEAASGTESFFNGLMRSADTNLGDLHPFLNELKTQRLSGDTLAQQSFDYYWSQQISRMLERAQEEGVVRLEGLKMLFLIDDFSLLSSGVRAAFCSLVKRLVSSSGLPGVKVGVCLSAVYELVHVPDVYGYWEDSISGALEVKLENLTRDETFRLLDSHDFDPGLIQRIYLQTNGNPGAVAVFIGDQSMKSRNSEEWYNRGRSLMLRFNEMQARWLRWAAILKTCNEESLSLLAEGRELVDCFNWIRSNYPVHFARENSDYFLSPENRRAVMAVVERDEPQLIQQCQERLQRFNGVRNAIPQAQHRRLLSYLSEMQFFNASLIKKVFDESMAQGMIELIDSKPVFFRQNDRHYRLASNIRAAIAVYNGLFRFNDRTRIRTKVAALWSERLVEIDRELLKLEKSLHEHEEKNRSLSGSLGKLEEEIQRFKGLGRRDHGHSRSVAGPRPSGLGNVATAVVLQLAGIGLLYLNTLVMARFSMTYFLLSLACIVGGLFVGSNRPKEVRQFVVGPVVGSEDAAHAQRIIERLNLDRVTLMNQKEQARQQIESCKSSILSLQTELGQTYIPDAATRQIEGA
jgi:hypothetical protein